MLKFVVFVAGVFLLCAPSLAFAQELDGAEQTVEVVLLEHSTMTHDVLLADKPALISVGARFGLAPNTPVTICLADTWCAEPAMTDQNGQLFMQISLPEQVPEGKAKLIVTSQNQAVEEVRLFKSIRVGGTALEANIWPED